MNEEQLVKELQKDNPDVFPVLVELYKNRVFSMAFKFTNDYNESEDLAQDIFLKIYKEIKNFRFECKLSTWIYKISINTCIDWKKKNRKIKIINFTSMEKRDNHNPLNNVSDEGLLPEDALVGTEQKSEIHQVIYNLPDIYKSVIILYHFNNLTYREISMVLKIPEKTVETRLYRARRKLKEELKKMRDGGVYGWNVEKL